MPLEAARHHARLHIAAQAQLQAQLGPFARNLALGLVVVPNDVAEAVRLPGEQGAQLGGGCAGGSLCEVDCDAEACGAGSLEDGGEEGYFALGTDGWVAAEV
ncbi:hypothetical protein MKX07_007660 [Trichoderma sp. CBMAI-0711]|nr:hypothetical protein MKX07_007660 [Trichoderma sp. CBMAI-0711]